MQIKLLLILLLTGAFSFKAYAEDKIVEEGTYLNLSATELLEVQQDLIIVNLRYEVDSDSAINAQNEINQVMKKALEAANEAKNIENFTDQYSVYKFYKTDEKGKNGKDIWRGSQNITLKSKVIDETLVLAGKLQALGLVMSNMYHELSPEKSEEIRISLMESAINKLLARARKVADIIGAKEVKIKTINIDGNNSYDPSPSPKLMMRSSGAMEARNEPVSAPGKTYVNFIVTAMVLLKD
jgi:predicted secreted protein